MRDRPTITDRGRSAAREAVLRKRWPHPCRLIGDILSPKVPEQAPTAQTRFRYIGCVVEDHSKKINHAAAAIRAKPAQWFHFSGWPRYQIEKPANTSRVITSCMPFNCGAL